MKCAVIIPVGPGHEVLQERAVASVKQAWALDPGPFQDMTVVRVPDAFGQLGRSKARNEGMADHPAEWYFLLDADDLLAPDAFTLVDTSYAATFGAVCLDWRTDPEQRMIYGLNSRISPENVWPLSRDDIFRYGPIGTLSMGCFVRGDLGLRFDETLDVGEDWDFFLRLPSFTKQSVPLVYIGYNQPSAEGPRSSAFTDWGAASQRVIERYRPGVTL